MDDEPSKNCTVPAAAAGETVPLSVAVVPVVAFPEIDSVVVVGVAGGLTTCDSAALVEAPYVGKVVFELGV